MKIAVILFNLGGPDSIHAVRFFLRNLFNDPAILPLPFPIRPILASFLSRRREKLAQDIYRRIGGRSPLLEQTEAQALALQNRLLQDGLQARCFIAMRYWNPMTQEALEKLCQWGAEEIILLPLYPQYSTTTTGSSLQEWQLQAKSRKINIPTHFIRSYPGNPGWVDAQATLLLRCLDDFSDSGSLPRILFSAHGLPERIVAKGDPYPEEVAITVNQILNRIGKPALDWVLCYQSKIGPVAWIGPSTESEIIRAGKDGKSLIVLPVSFVSDHSETLVELDLDYAELARRSGVPAYVRVPAVGNHPLFIDGLAGLVQKALNWKRD